MRGLKVRVQNKSCFGIMGKWVSVISDSDVWGLIVWIRIYGVGEVQKKSCFRIYGGGGGGGGAEKVRFRINGEGSESPDSDSWWGGGVGFRESGFRFKSLGSDLSLCVGA